jgi:hypothetical protein
MMVEQLSLLSPVDHDERKILHSGYVPTFCKGQITERFCVHSKPQLWFRCQNTHVVCQTSMHDYELGN